MPWDSATHNRRAGSRLISQFDPARKPCLRWYVPRALGEENATSAHPPHRLRGARSHAVSLLAFGAIASSIAGCGGGERQDVNEPSGNFPVEVTAAKFPLDQRLAETSDLQLEVKNSGDKPVPDLAVTIYTGDQKASGSFETRSDQPGLADPNRPVWILENEFPKCVSAAGYKLEPNSDARCISPTQASSKNALEKAQSAGADAAQTDTFSFGELQPGDSIDMFWRLTPVEAGTYSVHYELAAGLNGKAKAVTNDGGPVNGDFVVTINDKPPKASVSGNGNVVIQGG
jgi:hypothetical protein